LVGLKKTKQKLELKHLKNRTNHAVTKELAKIMKKMEELETAGPEEHNTSSMGQGKEWMNCFIGKK
jgi:hypothetical protein